MQTARTEPAEPAEHPETAERWVHMMIHGSAGLVLPIHLWLLAG